jgi:hypothetical protein
MSDDLFDWAEERGRERCPFPVPLDVCALFERLCLDLWRAGWEHYSARAILHRIRWHQHVEKGDRAFKANNNWTPALSRWVMRNHPEMGDFFQTRSSPGTPGHGPGHDTEDYMGPYA